MSPYQAYLFDLGFELKVLARKAREDRDNAPPESPDRVFKSGRLMAFHHIVSLMQQQADGLGIPRADLRLDDIEPDRDLL
jgi:hypothetical protein